jgi:hypothetical protein
MITITGLFPDRIEERVFDNVLDAMDFRNHLDAHYAKVFWTQS